MVALSPDAFVGVAWSAMRSLLGRTAAISVAALTVFVGVTAAGASADSTPDPQCAPVETSTTTTDAPESSAPDTTTAEPLESSTTTSTSTSTTTVDCDESTPIDEATAPSTTQPATSTTSTSTTTTSTSTTITTTTEVPGLGETEPAPTTRPPLLVADLPSPVGAAPQRGTDHQVAETLPPPSTTTTTTLPPEWNLPGNSGEGRRIVYRKSWPMRVWTVESNGAVSKTHLVSGRATWNQPTPGTYRVFSRSGYTCNINNPHICWRYMVRFTKGPGGDNIGFHEIPTNLNTGYKLQSESQLGLALSGGCVRQRTSDALYIWNWAPVGTKVVVLP